MENISVKAVRNIIDIPTSRSCNHNQFYTGTVKALGSNQGCTVVSALNVANIFGPTYGPPVYGITDFVSYWNAGYNFQVPPSCKCTLTNTIILDGRPDSEKFAKIRDEISLNKPVLIKLWDGSVQHYVVAYGYNGSGTSASEIKVFDPANNTQPNNPVGTDTTLNYAMQYNGKHIIKGLMLAVGNR